MTQRMSVSLTVTALALVFAALTLTGCAHPDEMFSDRREVRYDDVAQVDADPAPAIDTEVLPADATKIAAAWHTDDEAAMMTFVSATGPACEAAPLTGEPALEASWWPSTHPADGMVCGAWQVFGSGQNWYLYKS